MDSRLEIPKRYTAGEIKEFGLKLDDIIGEFWIYRDSSDILRAFRHYGEDNQMYIGVHKRPK